MKPWRPSNGRLKALSPRILSLRHREEQLAVAREEAAGQLERRRDEPPATGDLCITAQLAA